MRGSDSVIFNQTKRDKTVGGAALLCRSAFQINRKEQKL